MTSAVNSDRLSTLLQERIERGDFCNRLPVIFDGPANPRSTVVSTELQKKRLKLESMIASGSLGEATALIQSSYDAIVQIEEGVYEHEFLLRPLLEKFADGMGDMAAMTDSAEEAGYWHRDAPDNPFSAALFALSLQQLASSHSGANWLDSEADQSNIPQDQCIQRAALAMKEAAWDHQNHWFWRYSSLRLGLHDYQDSKDHWLRFERAVEAQPLSLDIWTNFAYQLLPRWHGQEGDLTRISKRAWMTTRKSKSAWLYLEVFKIVHTLEHGEHELTMLDEVADLLIQDFAGSRQDSERTLAVSAFASKENYVEAVKLMSRMKSLHTGNWLASQDPRWVMGMAEIHAPVNTLAA